MRTPVTRVLAASAVALSAAALGSVPAVAIPRPAAAQPSATPSPPPSPSLAAGSRPSATAEPRHGPSPTCAAGWAALTAGHLEQAKAIYDAVQPPGSACARAARSATADLLTARALNRVGYSTQAAEYLKRALEAEPTMPVPRDVLPATIGTQGRALAETLARDGFPGPAKQILLQVIENDPQITIESEDRVILGEANPSLASRAIHVLTSPLFLFAVVLLVLIVFSLNAKLRRSLHFQPFDAGDDASAGPGPTAILRSLIRRELHRLAEESARLRDGRKLRMNQAGPYEDQFDLGPVLDSLPSGWKPLALAVGTLMKGLGARSRLIGGMLLPTSAVILEIRTVNGVVKDMCTIKHHELGFPPSPSDQDILPQLAMPSAAWIALAHYPEATLGGTRDWRSYIDFAAGCAWQAKGDTNRARDCYVRACNNPDNLAARVNLAALEQRAECAVPQRDPASLPSYRRLSSLVRDTATMTGDLQWYRTRYLLSAGLRDVLDLSPNGTRYHPARPAPDDSGRHRATSVNGHGPHPAPPEQDETMIDLARRHAVELALELEEKIADRRGLPEAFVQYGRAAALTLVARQVDLRTGDLEKMLVDGTGRPDYTDGGAVRRALRNVLHNAADDGTAERLVGFVRSYCPIDDQAHYNLYRYHQTRASNLAAAIENWSVALRQARRRYGENPPGRVWTWAEDVTDWQKALASLYEAELSQMRECARKVEEGGDPVLIERLRITSQLEPVEPRFRYSNGRRHERPADDGSRLNSPAPSVTPDAVGPGPAPAPPPDPGQPAPAAPGQSGPAVPDRPAPTVTDRPAPAGLADLALPAGPPAPTRPDDGEDDLGHDAGFGPGDGGVDLAPPPDLLDTGAVVPGDQLPEAGHRDPGHRDPGDREGGEPADDYPNEPSA